MNRPARLLPLLPLLLALAACDSGEPAPPPPAAAATPSATATPAKETVGGDLQSAINYGTGATQVKAYKKATTQIKKISGEQNKALEEALQP